MNNSIHNNSQYAVCLMLEIGILLPKLLWPTVRKKNSSDRGKFLKFEAEGREFAKILRSLEQFVQTVRTIFDNRMLFYLVPGGFSDIIN